MVIQIFRDIFFAFIIFLFTMRFIKLARRKKQPLVTKLIKQNDYKQVAERYREMAKDSKREYSRENYLGIAALYEHQSEKAIDHFITASKSAIGNYINIINSNLAVAFLQKGAYSQAISILEEQREKGNICIIPYIFSLLIEGRKDEAKAFFQSDRPEFDSEYYEALPKLFNVNLEQPETLESVKNHDYTGELWLYQPVINYLIERWEKELFFLKPERYELLESEGRSLLSMIDSNPQLFTNTKIRFIRSIISLLLPRVKNYHSCASLFGIILNLDSLSLEQSLPLELGKSCAHFFDYVYYTFYKTRSADSYDRIKEEELMQEQCPTDAKPIVPKDYNAQINVSDTLNIGVRSYRNIDSNKLPIAFVDIISKAEVDTIKCIIEPIIELIPLIETDIKQELISLVEQVIKDRHSLSTNYLIDILTMVPKEYHTSFQQLREEIGVALK